MWSHPANEENISLLQKIENSFLKLCTTERKDIFFLSNIWKRRTVGTYVLPK